MPRFLSSLRVRLLLLVLVTAVPGIGLVLYEEFEQWQLVTDVSRQQALHVAHEISREHERYIEAARQLLMSLAQLPDVRKFQADSTGPFFADILRQFPSYTNLGAAKANGDLFASGLPFKAPLNIADQPYFQHALKTRDFTISKYQIGSLSGKPSITIAYPAVDKSGAVQAVVFVGLSLDWFKTFLATLQLPNDTVITLRDHDGAVIARYPDPEKWIRKPVADTPVFKAILSHEGEGTVEASDLDGVRRLYGFTKLRGLGLDGNIYVSVGISAEMMFSEINEAVYRDLALLGILVVLSLAGVWFGAGHFITRPVNDLIGATKRLAAGDLSARTGLPPGESDLNQLARSFDQMAESLGQNITERKRAAEALRESEMRFRSVTQSANDAIISADGSGKIISWNKGAQTIFGYAEEEVLHKPLATLMPERYRDAHRAGLERLRSTGKSNVLGKTVELHGLRKDGRGFPLELSLSNWEAEGKTFYSGIIRDITERKRAEEEVRRNLERIQALREIDQALASTLNLDAIFNVLLERVDTFLLYPAATMVKLFNQQTRELEFFTCRNLDKDEWKARNTSSQGGRAKVVFEAKEPLLIRNVQTDPRTWEPEFFRKHGLVSYLGVPLMAKGKPLGVLSLYTKQEHEFSKEEVDFLSTLAGQAAIAVQNSQLYEQTKKQTEELKKTIAELETANQVKNQFLSVMSHELRTPLNVVLGYTGMLRDGMLGEIPPEQKKVLGKVINRAGDLLTLIRDILQATQIESRSVIVDLHLVNLVDFLDRLKAGYDQPLDKELTLNWDYPADLPSVITDSEKLKQILQNLIHNAIKFTENGYVKISARIKQATEKHLTDTSSLPPHAFVEFKVADTGIGIPKESLPIIFDKFHQADSTETRLYGGVGLGLYIVKEFTELLGGTVQVESEPGKGSTFTVTLPLEQ